MLFRDTGVAVLYVRKRSKFSTFLIGGHQERGPRGGIENSAGIIGLRKACELRALRMEEENRRVKSLRDKLENGLLSAIPDCRINGDRTNRLPNTNTANISFEFVWGEAILLMMDQLDTCRCPIKHLCSCASGRRLTFASSD